MIRLPVPSFVRTSLSQVMVGVAAVIASCAWPSPVAGAQAQAPAISRVSAATATVAVVPGKPYVSVTIRNHARVPLEAWSLLLEYQPQVGEPGSVEAMTDTYPAIGFSTEHGPIPPSGSRVVSVPTGLTPARASVELRMALFEDFTWEGSRDDAALVLQRRQSDAEALAEWIPVLRAAISSRASERRGILQNALSEQTEKLQDDPSPARASAFRAVTEILESPGDSGMAQKVRDLLTAFERKHQLADRRRGRR